MTGFTDNTNSSISMDDREPNVLKYRNSKEYRNSCTFRGVCHHQWDDEANSATSLTDESGSADSFTDEGHNTINFSDKNE